MKKISLLAALAALGFAAAAHAQRAVDYLHKLQPEQKAEAAA